jgi:hypothetical protein
MLKIFNLLVFTCVSVLVFIQISVFAGSNGWESYRDYQTNQPVSSTALRSFREGEYNNYQGFVGLDKKIYIGYANSANVDFQVINLQGETSHGVTITAFDDILMIAHVGEDNYIYTGTYHDSLQTFSGWSKTNSLTNHEVGLTTVNVNSTMYVCMVHTGLDSKIYSACINPRTNSTSNFPWREDGGVSNSTINIGTFSISSPSAKVIQTHNGIDQNIYYRVCSISPFSNSSGVKTSASVDCPTWQRLQGQSALPVNVFNFAVKNLSTGQGLETYIIHSGQDKNVYARRVTADANGNNVLFSDWIRYGAVSEIPAGGSFKYYTLITIQSDSTAIQPVIEHVGNDGWLYFWGL